MAAIKWIQKNTDLRIKKVLMSRGITEHLNPSDFKTFSSQIVQYITQSKAKIILFSFLEDIDSASTCYIESVNDPENISHCYTVSSK